MGYPRGKIWKEQWGLNWSPFFISAPFTLTIESSQWKSGAGARILPASQRHTKKRHSDVSVWSVAMELQDNQPHGCLCRLVTPYRCQKNKEFSTYLWGPSSYLTSSVYWDGGKSQVCLRRLCNQEHTDSLQKPLHKTNMNNMQSVFLYRLWNELRLRSSRW